MPSLSPLPSPQPGVTVVSKNDMCNKKVVADADPATRHGNLALHQGSDDDVILGNEGGGSKPTDRHRPQGRFFDSMCFNKLKHTTIHVPSSILDTHTRTRG